MRKFTKSLLLSFIILFLSLLLINITTKKAFATTVDPSNHEEYLKSIAVAYDYDSRIETIIKESFPNFNILSTDFDKLVSGKSKYRILEITPRSFVNNVSEISDLESNMNEIKSIYDTITFQNDFTTKSFVANMPNFELDVMTIKQFVDNRDELDGKYDAIVFAAGDYSNEQVLSCYMDYDLSELEFKNVYGIAHRLEYAGYFSGDKYHGYGKIYDLHGNVIYDGQFNNGFYSGHGKLYNNGKLSYEGGFLNGERNCFGVIYNETEQEIYRGQWRGGNREGYGISLNFDGSVAYQGFFHNDVASPDYVPRDILDDITALKATEIINDYVLKGLPVFLNQDATSFLGFLENSYPNTTFENVYPLNYTALNANNNIEFYKTLSIMKITELLSQKPNIEFIEKPIDFSENPNHTYQSGDTIHFKVDLTNKELSDLLFYIDINQNEKFEDDELAYTLFINRGNNTFDFQIPGYYNGLLRYKIVLNNSIRSSLYEGTLKIKGDIEQIKVLNVVSEMVDIKDGLLDPQLFDLYFKNNGDYDITVDRCNVKEFSKNNSKKWDCSHYTVMDDYDVILLGQDIFDKSMNVHVYNSIQEQINLGKPIIFTSSVTKGNNKWVDYFHDDLSLNDYRTDLYKINNNVDKLQIVNDSNYILYPFNMNNEELLVPEDLNYALNEQYQVNLNNPNLVPLMNMYNTNNPLYDRYDSYNNFYYMKNDNVIYLNVGNNSFKVYKDIEHKLLVNSIVNSYVQYKAKDKKVEDFFSIDYVNTFENQLVDVNDHVQFSFSIFSNKVDNYHYTLYADSVELESNDISNNQLVNLDLSNFTSPNVNKITQVLIQLKIENSENETHTYDFYVFVGNLETYNITFHPTTLNNSLVIDGDKYLQINTPNTYSNNYKVDLGSINVSDLDTDKLPSQFVIRNVMFNQNLPENVTINDPKYVVTGNTLTNYLGDFTYTLQGDYYVPAPYNPINLTVPFTVTSTGNYTFEPAKVTFDGIGSDKANIQNGSVSFKAVKPLDTTMVTPIFTDYIFIPFGDERISDLTKKFIINDEAMVEDITFNTNDPVLDLNGYTLEANTFGEGDVDIVVQDIFGNNVRKTFKVLSYIPITSINIEDQSLYEGDYVVLPFNINTNNIKYELIKKSTIGNVVEITRNDNQFIIHGLEKGYAVYRFYGYDRDGYEVDATISIVVNEYSVIYLNEYFMSIFRDESITYNYLINNVRINEELTDSELDDVVFTSSDPEIASFNSDGNLIAHKPGTIIITASLPEDNESTQLLLKVHDYMSDNSGFYSNLDIVKIYQGYKQYLENFIYLDPPSLSKDDVEMIFTIDDPNGILEYFDITTNTFNTKIDQFGDITIHVTINQYNSSGEIVETVTDTYIMTIREIVDPNIDKGDNTH